MANQDFAHDFVDRPRLQVMKDTATTLTLKVFENGTQVVPDSCTIAIKMPGGAALPTPVTAGVVSVAGGGTMTYQISAANAAALGSNYTAEWTYLKAGSVYPKAIQLFDVVRYPLTNPVVTADLTKYHPDLGENYFSQDSSSAQSYIEMSYEDVCAYLDSKGKRHYLVLSVEDIRRPIEHRALALFFFPRVKEEGDRWDRYRAFHADQFERWMQSASFVYDESNDGVVSGGSQSEDQAGEERMRIQTSWEV